MSDNQAIPSNEVDEQRRNEYASIIERLKEIGAVVTVDGKLVLKW